MLAALAACTFATAADAITYMASRTVGNGSLNLSITTDGTLGTLGGGVIPEPATWAMLIAGFGLVGVALRRRTAVIA